LQGNAQSLAFVLSHSEESGWDDMMIEFFDNAIALPAPAILDVFDDLKLKHGAWTCVS
jgi:hypothetical protein